ncbi:hypothetical protein FA13DRAFT_1732355 [Coprinellus micaceus]|uniref:Uncharacterized protein n=1 Tax=Coprinellus micaceus TaxID=71717 RepID=A0A4Y7TC53_COPMI|nr:hypothetical protein FA13DRAFT_1732355 [Coprinellus micaceus]
MPTVNSSFLSTTTTPPLESTSLSLDSSQPWDFIRAEQSPGRRVGWPSSESNSAVNVHGVPSLNLSHIAFYRISFDSDEESHATLEYLVEGLVQRDDTKRIRYVRDYKRFRRALTHTGVCWDRLESTMYWNELYED